MSKKALLFSLPLLTVLAGCLGSNNNPLAGAGGGAAGGTGGGVAGPSTPAAAALSASGTGTIDVRGLSTRFEKNVSVATPVVTIYESGFGGTFNYGAYNSIGNFNAAQSGTAVSGTATFANAGTSGATLSLQPGGTYVGGAALTAFNGTAGSAPLPGRGQGTNQRYDQSGPSPISSTAVSLDTLGTGGFDLAKIDLQVNQANGVEQFEEVGIYFGGDFSTQAAVDAVPRGAGGVTQYSRVASGSSADAGLFSVSPLDGIAGEDGDIYRGDTSLFVNFTAGSVNGSIVNIRQADAGVGAAMKSFQLRLTGATLNGTTIDGGTLRVTNTAGTVLDTITQARNTAAFMGQNAEVVTGVFQATGTTSAAAGSIGADLGAPAGTPIFINGRITADR